jgi:hypothetical protein
MAPRRKAEKYYENEAALCRAFIEAATANGKWIAYAETGGWDIVMVRKLDGFQIGIQAKMAFNPEVIKQCLETYWGSGHHQGPDVRAVLVPRGNGQLHLGTICEYIGIARIFMNGPKRDGYRYGGNHSYPFDPLLPDDDARSEWRMQEWPQWVTENRIRLPDYVPDVAAGSPAPMQLTAWKINAIKIAVTIEKRGYVTRQDFKHHHIDYRRWLTPGSEWLARSPEGKLTPGRYFPNLKAAHPRNYQEIAADYEKWKMPESMIPPVQPKLI